MSGAVEILNDQPDEFVVACFNTDCPEHMHTEPWVDAFTTRKEANACAKEHRASIRTYWAPDDCPACGQRVKAETTPPAHPRDHETGASA